MNSLLRWVNLALFLSSGLAATTSGTFSVLSYNVAGLPDLVSSGNPEKNTPLISPRLAPYNVINVQEDFNYHAALYRDDNHAFRTATSGGAGFGSGLNTLSDFQFVDDERVTWNDCNFNGGDCLTPKGFTFLRFRASEGVWVDLYNLHTDAGSDSGDISARSKNFAQVAAFMETWSAGMPVIVMGDTNARYTRAGDSDSLVSFLSRTGTTDSWVKNARGGSAPASGADALVCPFPFAAGTNQAQMVACEVVDKIFTRGSVLIGLSATTFTNENDVFVDSAGAPLSDHYPISSRISWALSSSLRLADPVGGPHGDPFNDVPGVLSGEVPKLTSVTIRGGSRVDAVSFTARYASGSTTTVSHGGSGGNANTLNLASGEYVVEITACSGQRDGRTRVFYLNFRTNRGNTVSAGSSTSSCSTSTVPTDVGVGAWGLVGFWGRSGNEVDRLGAVWGASY